MQTYINIYTLGGSTHTPTLLRTVTISAVAVHGIVRVPWKYYRIDNLEL